MAGLAVLGSIRMTQSGDFTEIMAVPHLPGDILELGCTPQYGSMQCCLAGYEALPLRCLLRSVCVCVYNILLLPPPKLLQYAVVNLIYLVVSLPQYVARHAIRGQGTQAKLSQCLLNRLSTQHLVCWSSQRPFRISCSIPVCVLTEYH